MYKLQVAWFEALPISEVRKVDSPSAGTAAIFLSAGATTLGLLGKSPGIKGGLERIGFHVKSIEEIEERIKKAPPFLYPGEAEIHVMPSQPGNPGKSRCLKDPDGNIVEFSEEGWSF